MLRRVDQLEAILAWPGAARERFADWKEIEPALGRFRGEALEPLRRRLRRAQPRREQRQDKNSDHSARDGLAVQQRFGGVRERGLIGRRDANHWRTGQKREIALRRALIRRIVVLDEKPRHELTPVLDRLPLRDLFATVQRAQAIELCLERSLVFDEVPVLVQQKLDAGLEPGFQP